MQVLFEGEDGVLEGFLHYGPSRIAAVCCHPHPLWGGSMDNTVVEAIVEGYLQGGMSAVRFNFRGVGRSSGSYSGGAGERDDVTTVWNSTITPRLVPQHLAGYSFGAWVGADAAERLPGITGLTLVAPPLLMLNFSSIKLPQIPILVLCGERDDFAPPAVVESWLEQATEDLSRIRLLVLPADHFFGGVEAEVVRAVERFAREGP